MAHIHAKLMMQYAQDAMDSDIPWDRWEFSSNGVEWIKSTKHPSWDDTLMYRRKQKTININGFEVPEPLRVAPEIGDDVYAVLLTEEKGYFPLVYNGYADDALWFSLGVCHSTKEAAQAHAKALLSFSQK